MRVCCNSTPGKNLIKRPNGNPYNIQDIDATDAWTSQTMQTLRGQLLNNTRPDMCVRCFREEDAGIKSARQSWNQSWMFDYTPSVVPPAEIRYIDLRLGNLCNLKCRMCNPYASNQWTEEWNSIGNELSDRELSKLKHMNWFDDSIVWNNISKFAGTIEEIYLTGGEPTLAISQYQLFDTLIELNVASKIRLKYNTNLTNIPKKMIDYWQHFKQIKINASVDAYGDLNRYIRFPTAWASVEKNLKIFKDMELADKCRLQIHITVQIYNILYLDELFEYLTINNYTDIYINILNHPNYLNVRALPDELKTLVESKLKKWIGIDKLTGLIAYMFSESWYTKEWPNFLTYTSTLDSSRQQNFLDLCPEFSEFI